MGRGQEDMAQKGASILKRYRHPENWVDDPRFQRVKSLMVEEIRPGGTAVASNKEASMNARAIRAWAERVGLNTIQFQIDQRVDSPYILVPRQHWHKVLQLLQKL